MSNTLFYWDGINIDADLEQRCLKAIEQIRNGEAKSARLSMKHAPDCKIMAAKTGKGSRLLFTEAEVNGKQYIVFLKELRCHDEYDILKNKLALKNLVEKKKRQLHHQLESLTASASSFEDNTPRFIPVSIYDKQFILLDELQQQVVDAQGPLLINGAAGSGKSCCAFALITRAPKYMERILYLTRYDDLIASNKEKWQPVLEDMGQSNRIDVLSYEQLVRQHVPELSNKTTVDEQSFFQWHQEFMKNHQRRFNAKEKEKKHSKKTSKSLSQLMEPFPITLEDRQRAYEAMQIAVAYMPHPFDVPSGFTQSDYEKLPIEHSLLPDKATRQFNYLMTINYLQHLHNTNRVDFSLFKWKPSFTYDRVVIDEGQDFTLNMLQISSQLVSHLSQYYCCYDSRQDIENTASSRLPFSTFMHLSGAPIKVIELPRSYRISPCSLEFLEKISVLRLKLNGGRVDKYEQVVLNLAFNIKQTPGSYWWFDHCSDGLTRQVKDALGSNEVCILTIPEFVGEAKELFGTENVLTAKQIKGQQRQVVICYRMLEAHALVEANKLLANPEQTYLAQSSMQHKAPRGAGDVRFLKLLNVIHTLATRPKTQLIIIQPDNHRFQHLINALRPEHNPDLDFSIMTEASQFSRETWSRFIVEQAKCGHIDFARKMFIERLQGTQDEFEELLLVHMPKSTQSTKQVLNSTTTPPQQSVSVQTYQSKARSRRDKRQTPLTKATSVVLPQTKARTPISPFAVQGSTNSANKLNGKGLMNHSMFTEHQKFARVSCDMNDFSSVQHESVTNLMHLMLDREIASLKKKLLTSKNRSADLLGIIRDKSGHVLDAMLYRSALGTQWNIAALLTFEDLCLPPNVKLIKGSSLLSHLCSPYDGIRHQLLHDLLSENKSIYEQVVSFIQGMKDVTPEQLASDGFSPTRKSMIFELANLLFLSSTPQGMKLLKNLEVLIGGGLIHVLVVFREYLCLGVNFDLELVWQREPHAKKLFVRLHTMPLHQWQQLIESNIPLTGTGARLLRLVCNDSLFAYSTWKTYATQDLSLYSFFVFIRDKWVNDIVQTNIELELLEEIILHLSQNQHLGQDEYYSETLEYLSSLLAKLHLFFKLTTFIRVLYDQLYGEQSLLNQLNTIPHAKRVEMLQAEGNPKANCSRRDCLMQLMHDNEKKAQNLWDNLAQTKDMKIESADILLTYFNLIYLELVGLKLAVPGQLTKMTMTLGQRPQWTLQQSIKFINTEMQHPDLAKTRLFAGGLRLAHTQLRNLFMEELTAIRKGEHHVSELCSPAP